MENKIENEFLTKVESIRSKNLRNFLTLYFHSYVDTDRKTNPIFSEIAWEYREKHPPRVFPGLATIRKILKCEKTTAQDYLRAIYITQEIFFAKNQREALKPIRKREYNQLLKDLSPLFNEICKLFSIDNQKALPTANKQLIRERLNKAAKIISEQSGGFAPDECAHIVRELANWFV